MKAIVALLVLGFALFFVATVDANGWHSALIGWAIFAGIVSVSTALGLLAAGPRP